MTESNAQITGQTKVTTLYPEDENTKKSGNSSKKSLPVILIGSIIILSIILIFAIHFIKKKYEGTLIFYFSKRSRSTVSFRN